MRALLRLKPYLRPFLPLMIGSAALAIPLSALRATPALLIKHIIDEVLSTRNETKLKLLPVVVIGLYVVNFIVRFFHYYLMRIVVARVSQKLKNDLYEHLLGLSADHFTAQSTGALISRVGSDPEIITNGVYSFNSLVREPITFVFLFCYALTLNWRLTLVTLLIFPPLAWVFSRTGKNLKRYISRIAEENANLFSALQETFTGIRVVKAFRLEKYVRKKFRERADEYTKYVLKSAVLEETSHPTVELLTSFLIAGIAYYGGLQVLHGKLTAGGLFAFFACFALMMQPIRALNDVNIKIHQAAAACVRIFEIFDWKSSVIEAVNPKPIRGFEREIVFDRVSFAYPDSPERAVLKNLTFAVPRGSVVALVGRSGVGKSSLVSLLPRVFDITSGAIRIDGQDIRELDLDSLRKQIAIVSQDVFLFNDTIEENIRCGRLAASREEIREAARQAHALEFIESMPQGFQTVIGDRGQRLSGGERQRVSIARAFLRQAPILILDEATSSLDSKSEQAVQEALDELMVNRTCLVVAHRLSTVRNANQILVMRDGEIVERGRHDDLLKLGGEYAKFHGLAAAANATGNLAGAPGVSDGAIHE